MKIEYSALFTREENGLYSVEFPNLPGCVTDGDSRADVVSHAEEGSIRPACIPPGERAGVRSFGYPGKYQSPSKRFRQIDCSEPAMIEGIANLYQEAVLDF